MPEIEMNVGECTRFLTEWQTYKACRNGRLEEIKNILENLLKNDWQSKSADQYKQKMQRIMSELKDREKAIDLLATRLEEAIKNQKEAAEQLTQ